MYDICHTRNFCHSFLGVSNMLHNDKFTLYIYTVCPIPWDNITNVNSPLCSGSKLRSLDYSMLNKYNIL